MADTEKITINMGVVDLGQIDLLVEQGFYSSRTDFIRAAIRRQLDMHGDEVKQSVTRRAFVIGVLSYSRQELERRREKGEMLDVRVVGLVRLDSDITPDLARSTIESLTIRGVLRAPDSVKTALADRIS